MRFFYFLHFTSDVGHVGQLAMHVPTGKIYSRTSFNGGAFSGWRRLDVARREDGSLNEAVYESTRAKDADVAGRLRQPMRIVFDGDVEGAYSFDGSQNVTCTLNAKKVVEESESIKDIKKDIRNLQSRVDRLENYVVGN